jgi:large subunit ribosomal protein L33
MAKKRTIDKVMMIPEGESRDSVSFSFVQPKSSIMQRAGTKFRMRKYHPGLRQHVWFIEAKMPQHK